MWNYLTAACLSHISTILSSVKCVWSKSSILERCIDILPTQACMALKHAQHEFNTPGDPKVIGTTKISQQTTTNSLSCLKQFCFVSSNYKSRLVYINLKKISHQAMWYNSVLIIIRYSCIRSSVLMKSNHSSLIFIDMNICENHINGVVQDCSISKANEFYTSSTFSCDLAAL